jgi:hypothetical protein
MRLLFEGSSMYNLAFFVKHLSHFTILIGENLHFWHRYLPYSLLLLITKHPSNINSACSSFKLFARDEIPSYTESNWTKANFTDTYQTTVNSWLSTCELSLHDFFFLHKCRHMWTRLLTSFQAVLSALGRGVCRRCGWTVCFFFFLCFMFGTVGEVGMFVPMVMVERGW